MRALALKRLFHKHLRAFQVALKRLFHKRFRAFQLALKRLFHKRFRAFLLALRAIYRILFWILLRILVRISSEAIPQNPRLPSEVLERILVGILVEDFFRTRIKRI